MIDTVHRVPYGTRFDEALMYASELHRDQFRKGTSIPYIIHLLAVSALVGEHGGTEDEVIAALLHDAVEDQGGVDELERIRSRVGSVVADIVHACSDTFENPKPEWRVRKERYIAHIGQASPSVVLVSAADKLHNARSIHRDLLVHGNLVWNRFNAKRDEQLWYYRALVNAFHRRIETLGTTNAALRAIVNELSHVVGEIDRSSTG